MLRGTVFPELLCLWWSWGWGWRVGPSLYIVVSLWQEKWALMGSGRSRKTDLAICISSELLPLARTLFPPLAPGRGLLSSSHLRPSSRSPSGLMLRAVSSQAVLFKAWGGHGVSREKA